MQTDRDAVLDTEAGGPKQPRIRWGTDPPWEEAILRGKGIPRHARQHSDVSCAKTAEPIEMPFGLWTRVGPRKHVLDGVYIRRPKGQF